MIDYQELKRLAEAATPGPWVKSAPGEVATAEYEADGEMMCDHIASGFGCGVSDPDDAAFVAAANPAAVLALIAEVERWKAIAANQKDQKNFALEISNDRREERDQLKAEVEALRNAAEKVIEMNRQHAEDQYGDANKAESWSCVMVLRAAVSKENGQ